MVKLLLFSCTLGLVNSLPIRFPIKLQAKSTVLSDIHLKDLLRVVNRMNRVIGGNSGMFDRFHPKSVFLSVIQPEMMAKSIIPTDC